MLLTSETENIQLELANYCRTGFLKTRIEGVRDERLHHHRRLVYGTITDTLKRAFPILVKVLGPEKWELLVNTFFRNNNCETPQIWKLPGEFYEYYKTNPPECIYIHPYLIDLLYFEWVEIEVHTMADEVIPDAMKTGNWLTDIIVLNPEHKIINLTYPVHLYKPEEAVKYKGQYFIFIYREKILGNVKFLNIPPLHTLIIERIKEEASLEVILEEVAALFTIKGTAFLASHILGFMEDLKKQGVILGFRQ